MSTSQNNPKHNLPISDQGDTALGTLGDFKLHREIGRGGMGTVYEAWQHSLQRKVALKILGRHVSASSRAIERFKREASTAAKLHHAHIVPIFAQGEQDGVYYYAMEYVDGDSLNKIIARYRQNQNHSFTSSDTDETVALSRAALLSNSKTRIEENQSDESSDDNAQSGVMFVDIPKSCRNMEYFIDVAEQIAHVADALDYAHQQGVIHRDIKPHNLILGVENRLRIFDFGLARLSEQPGVTMTGEWIGSPLYMSPEQVTGNYGKVDHRIDVYSLGATMYEWLTLTPPYPGETREQVISKILSTQPQPLRVINPHVPVDLETICLKAIDRDRNRRYRSAGEFRDDLRRFLAKQPIKAKRDGMAVRMGKSLKRNPLASLSVAAIIMALFLGWAWYSAQSEVNSQSQAVVLAQEEAEVAKQTTDQVLDLLSALPLEFGGPIRVVEAFQDLVRPSTAGDEATANQSDMASDVSNLPTVGTPASIARRTVADLYKAIEPDWDILIPSLGSELSEEFVRAVSYFREGNLRQAGGLLDIHVANSSTPDKENYARYLRMAIHSELGEYEGMIEDARYLVRSSRRSPQGYLWRGLTSLLLDQIDMSLYDLKIASELDDQSVWIKVARGLALIRDGRADGAILELDDAIRLAPDQLITYLGRASAYFAAGRHQDALPDITRVLDEEPDNPDALTIRGDCYMVIGEFTLAANDYQRAMNISGQTATIGVRYLSALVQQRQMNKVKSMDTSADSESPLHPEMIKPKEVNQGAPVLYWLSRLLSPGNHKRVKNPKASPRTFFKSLETILSNSI